MAFFDSDIVQDEAKRLFSDYQQLMQLGSEYGKFDREGKKKFIETMEELMGRYRDLRPSYGFILCEFLWCYASYHVAVCIYLTKMVYT